ncbi:hypothetical protein [Nitrososphaera sp.]|uniref:hypothetical protein n=1 Tax=Nitrososphaera sp. TaxID=1971748 RepID=UPI002ED90540
MLPIIVSQLVVLTLGTLHNRFLLGCIGISIAFWWHILVYLALAVIVVAPGGTGEVVRAQFIKRESSAPIPTTALLYFVERFLDTMSILRFTVIVDIISARILTASYSETTPKIYFVCAR